MEATVIKNPEVLHFSNNPVEKIKNLWSRFKSSDIRICDNLRELL